MKQRTEKTVRLFVEAPLETETVELSDDRSHYLRDVLRQRVGNVLVVFNGAGTEREARIELLTRDRAILGLERSIQPLPESRLRICLIQSLVKSEAMDWIVQKSTELGVHEILPVFSDYTVVKLNDERVQRRLAHWRRIAASSCEQSGRHRPPIIAAPQPLADGLRQASDSYSGFALYPGAAEMLGTTLLGERDGKCLALLIGSEGGLSKSDLGESDSAGFSRVSLGPRILRADTAALSACAILQSRWGDS